MDDITKEQRSFCMSQIHSSNTKIETQLRKYLWRNGIRGYRLHNKNIPGKPDIYFPGKKTAIFLDGCYWHNCPTCSLKPKSNRGYWIKKLETNKLRDININRGLKERRIKVIRIWGHSIKSKLEKIGNHLINLLTEDCCNLRLVTL